VATESVESSPQARSAGVTLARADAKTASSTGDRYRDYERAAFTPERESSTADSTSEPKPAEPSPSTAAESTTSTTDAPAVAQAADRYRLSAEPPAAESVTIARGQDPPATSDRSEPFAVAPLSDADTSDMKSKFEATDARQPDSEPVRASEIDRAAADRARQAFAAQPASAAPDRYAPAATPEGGETVATRDNAPSYPFATQASRTSPIVGQAPDATSSSSQMPPPSNNPFAAAAAGANNTYQSFRSQRIR
jgi:hypothetical protein